MLSHFIIIQILPLFADTFSDDFRVPEIWNLSRRLVLVTIADLDFRVIWGFGGFLSTLLHSDIFSFVRISTHYLL